MIRIECNYKIFLNRKYFPYLCAIITLQQFCCVILKEISGDSPNDSSVGVPRDNTVKNG